MTLILTLIAIAILLCLFIGGLPKKKVKPPLGDEYDIFDPKNN